MLWGSDTICFDGEILLHNDESLNFQELGVSLSAKFFSTMDLSLSSHTLISKDIEKVKKKSENEEKSLFGVLLICKQGFCPIQNLEDGMKHYELPLYDYSVNNLGDDTNPFGKIKMLSDGTTSLGTIIRKNVHFSFRK